MTPERTILHCDLNGFFASVEELSHPEVAGRPMAVAGDPESRHGIILAKNEAAKRFGVLTAETIWQAKRKCPQLILLPASHGKYSAYSEKVNEIYARFTNLVEPFGIDESWLDVTASAKLFGSGREIADKIRKTIRDELGLTVSVGVSFNKVFSKLASDYKKPDATTVFARGDIERLVHPLNVRDMLYVGKATATELSSMGIRSIGQLAKADAQKLARKFGKFGHLLHDYANGMEDSPVSNYGEESRAKSIGNAITFRRDLVGIDDVKTGLARVAEKVAARLEGEKLKCLVVQITIKTPQFKVFTRQTTLEKPTFLRKDLIDVSLKLLKASWDVNSPIRMLGVAGASLVDASAPVQADLFETPKQSDKKSEKAQSAFHDVRKKFGNSSIKFGNLFKTDL